MRYETTVYLHGSAVLTVAHDTTSIEAAESHLVRIAMLYHSGASRDDFTVQTLGRAADRFLPTLPTFQSQQATA